MGAMMVPQGAIRCHNGAKMVPELAGGCRKVPYRYERCQYVWPIFVALIFVGLQDTLGIICTTV